MYNINSNLNNLNQNIKKLNRNINNANRLKRSEKNLNYNLGQSKSINNKSYNDLDDIIEDYKNQFLNQALCDIIKNMKF